jgi:hypothetical protein
MNRRLQILAAALGLAVVVAVFLLPALTTPAALLRGTQVSAHVSRSQASTLPAIAVTMAVITVMLMWVITTELRQRNSLATDPLRQTCALRC